VVENINMFVYCITNKIDKKQYVGITKRTVEARFLQHTTANRNNNSFLTKAIKQYSKENFTYITLEIVNDKKELVEKERYWIDKLNTIRPNGYNKHKGGTGGINEAIKLRMRAVICKNTRESYSSVQDAADKLSLNRTNISAVCRGLTDTAGGLSFEYVDKSLREASEKRKNDRINTRNNNVKIAMLKLNKTKALKIKCVNTGQIFESLIEASKIMNISVQSIHCVCNGYTNIAKGMKFEFIDSKRKCKADNISDVRQKKTNSQRLSSAINMGTINRKPVICLTTNILYGSIKEAALTLNIDGSSISRVIRGYAKTAGGMTFAYYTKKEENYE